MSSRTKTILIIALVVIVVLLSVRTVAMNNDAPPTTRATESTEQINEAPRPEEEKKPMETTATDQEYTLTGSNLSCSTTTVNGMTSHNCTGAIYVVPATNQSQNPGVYKINEQTQLLHDNVQQDLQSLQQLAQNRTNVRVTMADNSSDTLAKIVY